MTLGAKLNALRRRKGASLQEVADAVSSTKAYIWELEQGRSKNPSLDLLQRLADYHAVSLSSLVGEDPEAAEDDAEAAITLFRDLKNLKPEDQEFIKSMVKTLKERQREQQKKDGGDDD